jgi:hypothetical protein
MTAAPGASPTWDERLLLPIACSGRPFFGGSVSPQLYQPVSSDRSGATPARLG